ncbi:hypothetical protein O0L34_g14326 [Tuta absoluta]|nr:hypothetical protein O0L34_g14326 [Tuta absoluta]
MTAVRKKYVLPSVEVTEHPLMVNTVIEPSAVEDDEGEFSLWGHCTLDVLLMVLERLDPVNLMNCIQVNSYWRDAVNYMGVYRGVWKQLAQAGMVNGGIHLSRRASPKLDWRDIYINYQLWQLVKHADVSWSFELSDQDIRHLHVYKDILITESNEGFSKKYYHIEEQLVDVTSQLTQIDVENIDQEQSDNRIVDADGDVLRETVEENGITDEKKSSYMSDRMIKMLVQEKPFTSLLVLDEDCYYMIDQQSILRCVRWDETNQRWLSYVLARYYMCNKSISDISVFNGDVYMLLKTGLVFKLDRAGRNFIADQRFNGYLTAAQFEVSRMIYGEIETSVEQAATLRIPEYGTGTTVMFQDISVVVSVPWDKEYKTNVDEKSGNIVIEYPGLSCAAQYGKILFLGFLDGKVEISIAKNLMNNGGKSEITTNVKNCLDYPQSENENPAIVSIEVFEDIYSHQVFVATNCSIYRLTVTHPRLSIDRIGLDKDFVVND